MYVHWCISWHVHTSSSVHGLVYTTYAECILRECGFMPRDKTVSKEDILGAYPLIWCGLSTVGHVPTALIQ